MLRKVVQASLLVVGVSIGSQAWCQAYVGVSGGFAQWDVDCAGTTACDDSGESTKIYGGYKLTPNFALEGAHVSLGQSTAAFGPFQAEIKATGWELLGVLNAPIGNKANLFGKLGLSSMRGETIARYLDRESSESVRSINPVFGLGASYNLNKFFALRAEWESRMVEVPGDKGSVHNFNLGLQIDF